MNDAAIDFMKLRKLEKLRARKERLARRTNNNASINANDNKEIGICNKSMTTPTIPAASTIPMPSCCTTEFLETTNIANYQVTSIPTTTSTNNNTTNNNNPSPVLNHVYYIPECLTHEYMECISKWLQSLPNTTTKTTTTNIRQQQHQQQNNNEKDCNGKWTRLKHAQRNVALFDLRNMNKDMEMNATEEATTSNTTNNTNNTNTALLDTLCNTLVNIKAFPPSYKPNHVLINEYQPMEGIMKHTDGPMYYHKTATFSIGGDVLFQFSKRRDGDRHRDRDGNGHGNGNGSNTTIHTSTTTATATNTNTLDDDVVMEIMLSGKGSLIVFDDDAYINHCHSINDRISSVSNGVLGGAAYDRESHDDCEYASNRCVNLEEGSIVKRSHRYSLTFRHKY